MLPAQPLIIKQNLNEAYRLFKPSPIAAEAFRRKLILLLGKISGEETGEPVTEYLAAILRGTYLEFGYETPQNSSPVCYVAVTGLREGFEDPFLTEEETPAYLNYNVLSSISKLPAKTTLNPDLKQAIHLTTSGLREIFTTRQTNSPAEKTSLEKQIAELVYQLYELTPEEIKMVEGSKK